MTTLYVKGYSTYIGLVSKRLKVMRAGSLVETVRLRDLERVVLLGNVEVSGPAMAALLDNGIDVVLLSHSGRFRGRLEPAEGKSVLVRQAQFRKHDDMEFRLRVGRAIVEAKIQNSRSVVQRYLRNHPDCNLGEAVSRLQFCRENVARQTTLDALLGVEGDAAKVYFQAFGSMVGSEFSFESRTRRPPRDPVNALLSFGYTLLTAELAGAVAAEGLDIHVGFLHELAHGRPSLALDMVEEFRQPIVDRLVLSLINRGVLKRDHFEDRGQAGVLLNDTGRDRFIGFYHHALDAEFGLRVGHDDAEKTTYRELFRRQARRMREAVIGGADYEPFTIR
jgi:CRISPR-associated protein Cas1